SRQLSVPQSEAFALPELVEQRAAETLRNMYIHTQRPDTLVSGQGMQKYTFHTASGSYLFPDQF
ncbi:MAG: hypothetical protein HDS95_07905, partial [Bacteroidales bacterium]|nr:hypothetical protein [Bacteroidales bacterium]